MRTVPQQRLKTTTRQRLSSYQSLSHQRSQNKITRKIPQLLRTPSVHQFRKRCRHRHRLPPLKHEQHSTNPQRNQRSLRLPKKQSVTLRISSRVKVQSVCSLQMDGRRQRRNSHPVDQHRVLSTNKNVYTLRLQFRTHSRTRLLARRSLLHQQSSNSCQIFISHGYNMHRTHPLRHLQQRLSFPGQTIHPQPRTLQI